MIVFVKDATDPLVKDWRRFDEFEGQSGGIPHKASHHIVRRVINVAYLFHALLCESQVDGYLYL